jgi:hypothetical protein
MRRLGGLVGRMTSRTSSLNGCDVATAGSQQRQKLGQHYSHVMIIRFWMWTVTRSKSMPCWIENDQMEITFFRQITFPPEMLPLFYGEIISIDKQ